MISVAEALEALFALVTPLEAETVPLTQASGRVLAQTMYASRTQPPFAASAMDGYAVPDADVVPGQTYDVIGEAAAGHGFAGAVGPGECVRIFTGAPLPQGAERVVIQEDVSREGDQITIGDALDPARYVRPAGADFAKGDPLGPRLLRPSDIALLAAMNHCDIPVTRRPEVAIIATGDELVQPGEAPGPDQIIASNSYGLAALIAQAGGVPRLLPIARDNHAALALAFDLAKGADLILTLGGASVGDHDLVGEATAARGMERSFYKVAMRPGKPLMAGRMGDAAMIGLPGNPVSAMVCGHVFVRPVLRKMMGLGEEPAATVQMPLAHDLPANGPRAHYMRGEVNDGQVKVFERQDSALLTVLAAANALVVRPPQDPPRRAGDMVDILKI